MNIIFIFITTTPRTRPRQFNYISDLIGTYLFIIYGFGYFFVLFLWIRLAGLCWRKVKGIPTAATVYAKSAKTRCFIRNHIFPVIASN